MSEIRNEREKKNPNQTKTPAGGRGTRLRYDTALDPPSQQTGRISSFVLFRDNPPPPNSPVPLLKTPKPPQLLCVLTEQHVL